MAPPGPLFENRFYLEDEDLFIDFKAPWQAPIPSILGTFHAVSARDEAGFSLAGTKYHGRKVKKKTEVGEREVIDLQPTD